MIIILDTPISGLGDDDMLDKIHTKIYKFPQFLKYFYIMCLSAATIDILFERSQLVWRVIVIGIMGMFNYYILIAPKNENQ